MLGSVRAGVEVFSGSFYGPPQGQRHPHKDAPFSDSGNLKQKDRPMSLVIASMALCRARRRRGVRFGTLASASSTWSAIDCGGPSRAAAVTNRSLRPALAVPGVAWPNGGAGSLKGWCGLVQKRTMRRTEVRLGSGSPQPGDRGLRPCRGLFATVSIVRSG